MDDLKDIIGAVLLYTGGMTVLATLLGMVTDTVPATFKVIVFLATLGSLATIVWALVTGHLVIVT